MLRLIICSISLNGNLLSLSNIGLTSPFTVIPATMDNTIWGLAIGNIITSHEPSWCTAQVINREQALRPTCCHYWQWQFFFFPSGDATISFSAEEKASMLSRKSCSGGEEQGGRKAAWYSRHNGVAMISSARGPQASPWAWHETRPLSARWCVVWTWWLVASSPPPIHTPRCDPSVSQSHCPQTKRYW